jgi:hypothetical protein
MLALPLAAVITLLVAGPILPERGADRADAQTLSDGTQLAAARSGKPISLRDRLIVGLKAISKSDLAFVDRVVIAVNAGRLPKRLVDQTFFWARDRAALSSSIGHERRPIIYFRPVMTAQAKRLGVTL